LRPIGCRACQPSGALTDRQIDRLVCDVYGLTLPGEEIAVVEGGAGA
jgi:hypothetical protein